MNPRLVILICVFSSLYNHGVPLDARCVTLRTNGYTLKGKAVLLAGQSYLLNRDAEMYSQLDSICPPGSS